MKALVLSPSSRSASVKDIPIPSPGPREVLIRVRAVALNHVDALYANNPIATQDDRVIGSDFSGEVVQVGEGLDVVDDTRAQIGARVAGFVQGGKSCTSSRRVHISSRSPVVFSPPEITRRDRIVPNCSSLRTWFKFPRVASFPFVIFIGI